MAISDLNDYISHKTFELSVWKSASAARTYLGSSWTSNPKPGAAPTTAETCDNTTTGALNKESSIGISSYDWRFVSLQLNLESYQSLLMIDRLSHQGGLAGNTSATQTTNLPTAALTRYTNGNNVFAAIEIYTAIGSVQTTATISYTNQSGTSGRTSKQVVIGGTSFSEAGRMLVFPLQDGDTGVRSVESVTLADSTTTAGNFGITLFKVVGMSNTSKDSYHSSNSYDAFLGGGGHFEPILPGCCLMLLNNGLISSVSIYGNISFMNV